MSKMRIHTVDGSDELSEWELKAVEERRGEHFVYNYESYGYEGSGFAMWSDEEKYGYAYLEHCSCNGPLDGMDSILYAMDEIEQLAKRKMYGWERAEPVIEKMKELENK